MRRGDPAAIDEPPERGDARMPRRVATCHAVPDEDDRLSGRPNELGGAIDGRVLRPRVRRAPDLERTDADVGARDVLRQLDVGRARLLEPGEPERLADDLRRRLGHVEAGRSPRDGAEPLNDVEVLVRLFVPALEPRLTGDRDERPAVQL